ncbi:VOC family protein [Cellulomonas composti]|uniref:VOC family protein n=1 Tax=Cellulomonas composti TaxID=266130 RepID=UPI001FE6F1AE|nr:VOC family protein [Cellulomonas composti]
MPDGTGSATSGVRAGWLTVFVDLAPDEHAAGAVFWAALTGAALSASRGAHDEFATLLPASGAAYLRVQRLGAGPSGVHLDLHVPDLDDATALATGAGASVVARPGHVVLRSPGGFPFCLVGLQADDDAASRTPPVRLADGHRSIADQLTIDVTPDRWDDEVAFWPRLTGWPAAPASRPGMVRLHTPSSLPVRVLLQRKDEGPTSGHVDVATDDRPAEVARLVALGAGVAALGPAWTVLDPPAGPSLCVTDRDPATGLVPR